MKVGLISIVTFLYVLLATKSMAQVSAKKPNSVAEVIANMSPCCFCQKNDGPKINSINIRGIIKDTAPSIHDEIVLRSCRFNLSVVCPGIVMDEDHKPVPYASVRLLNSKTGVKADSLGKFFITVRDTGQKKLEVSSIGFYSRIVDISSDPSGGNIVLKRADTISSSVTIISSGTSRRRIQCFCGSRVIRLYGYGPKAVDNGDTLVVFPNPAFKGALVNIQMNKAGTYHFQLVDNPGKTINQQAFTVTVKKSIHQYQLPSTVAAGIYYIVVVDKESGRKYIQKLIIQ